VDTLYNCISDGICVLSYIDVLCFMIIKNVFGVTTYFFVGIRDSASPFSELGGRTTYFQNELKETLVMMMMMMTSTMMMMMVVVVMVVVVVVMVVVVMVMVWLVVAVVMVVVVMMDLVMVVELAVM